jgi:hypothetical protein
MAAAQARATGNALERVLWPQVSTNSNCFSGRLAVSGVILRKSGIGTWPLTHI